MSNRTYLLEQMAETYENEILSKPLSKPLSKQLKESVDTLPAKTLENGKTVKKAPKKKCDEDETEVKSESIGRRFREAFENYMNTGDVDTSTHSAEEDDAEIFAGEDLRDDVSEEELGGGDDAQTLIADLRSVLTRLEAMFGETEEDAEDFNLDDDDISEEEVSDEDMDEDEDEVKKESAEIVSDECGMSLTKGNGETKFVKRPSGKPVHKVSKDTDSKGEPEEVSDAEGQKLIRAGSTKVQTKKVVGRPGASAFEEE